MTNATLKKRINLRVEAFELSIGRIGFSICKQAAGKLCEIGTGCGRERIVRGITLCDGNYNKRKNK